MTEPTPQEYKDYQFLTERVMKVLSEENLSVSITKAALWTALLRITQMQINRNKGLDKKMVQEILWEVKRYLNTLPGIECLGMVDIGRHIGVEDLK